MDHPVIIYEFPQKGEREISLYQSYDESIDVRSERNKKKKKKKREKLAQSRKKEREITYVDVWRLSLKEMGSAVH